MVDDLPSVYLEIGKPKTQNQEYSTIQLKALQLSVFLNHLSLLIETRTQKKALFVVARMNHSVNHDSYSIE